MSGRGPKRGTRRDVTWAPAAINNVWGRKAKPARERAVSEHVLHVERLEVPRPEECSEHQQHHDVAAGDVARPEDAERHQRCLGDPCLKVEERADQQHAQGERHEYLGRAPRVGLGPHDAEYDRGETGGHRDGTPEVEVSVAQVRPRLGHVAKRGHQGDRTDGHVDEEDPPPVEEFESGCHRRARLPMRRQRRPRSRRRAPWCELGLRRRTRSGW